MMQLLNNIWIILSQENVKLVNILLIPASVIEAYLFMSLFLIILDIKSTAKQKIIYIICMSLVGLINLISLPSPLNILINYTFMLFLIKYIFKLNLLKSFVSLIISIFVFVLINVLFQNLYFSIFNINAQTFMNTPIYRLAYLTILYLTLTFICIFLKKFKKIKFNLSILDNLDRKTFGILVLNLIIGFFTLCIQLITTAFYIDIVPVSITILNFILLISFLILSIYSFTRMIKLYNTSKDLESAEEYNKSLEILYDKVKGFKHDFDNIVATLDGFIENNDITGLKDYFKSVKRDCQITNNLAILNPRIINNPGIYSLLNNKYFKATNSGVTFEINFFLDLNTLKVNVYEFSRALGILLDNAIEEAEKCENKLVRLTFRNELKNNRAIILVENTYLNKDVNIDKIFEKGFSGKNSHSGIGLWEVKNYIIKNKNLDLFTTKNNEFFKQELSIYNF